jgi:hypothetical protein
MGAESKENLDQEMAQAIESVTAITRHLGSSIDKGYDRLMIEHQAA